MKSRGAPIDVGGRAVIQMDKIGIERGVVTVRFLSRSGSNVGGVAIEAPGGHIVHSGGKKARLLYTWYEVGLPDTVEHQVHCPEGKLRVWNIYRIRHKSGLVTEDAFTGNAGMIVSEITSKKRRYECSDAMGDFDPTNLVFEVEWQGADERE